MSLRRLSVGAGYKYLMQSIASGDGPVDVDRTNLERYYHATGTPPGRFFGRGLSALNHGAGVAPGTIVEDEHLRRMLKELADPMTGEPLSARKLRTNAVGSFDLTFSPSKSVSTAWALADSATRQAIYECHQEAIAEVLAYADEHVFRVRAGKDGVVSDRTRGVIAASFTHFDSRAGDPQLHDHVVVMNRVQGARDGQWRSLDSRAIFRSAVELSELHNGLLADRLSERLGFDWEAHTRRHSTVPKWEIEGVSTDLMAAFSQRSEKIEAAKNNLIMQFEADHDRSPTAVEIIRLRQTATLSTRPAKHHHSLEGLITDWRERAGQVLGQSADELDAYVPALVRWPQSVDASTFSDEVIASLANEALERVSTKRATFSASNLRAEGARLLQGTRFASAQDRIDILRALGVAAVGQAVLLNTPDLRSVPDIFTRESETLGFHDTAHLFYTSKLILDAEGRLLTSGEDLSAPKVGEDAAATIAAQPLPGRQYALSHDQAAAVVSVAASGRQIDLLVGPAGSGKSTAMAGLKAIWESEHGSGSVIGLAPSAAAAQVLGDELSIDTENVTKFLHEYRQNGERRRELDELETMIRLRYLDARPPTPRMARTRRELTDAVTKWQLHAGQLVIVDEASMLSTFDFDELASAVRVAGAKLLCVGDYAQLTSVAAGGMFSTLVDSRSDVAALATLQRFGEPWEAAATLLVRSGRDTAFYAYQSHDRLVAGPREDLTDAIYRAWRHDLNDGKTSLMMARDNATVAALNARARVERLARGEVVGECRIAAGAAGQGDLVVTRHNDRHLVDSAGEWVRNGDLWTVTALNEDGSLSLARHDNQASVTVPAAYAGEHLELGYASTMHRAQGRTVDRAHCLVDPATSRETLYVGVSRGRESNMLYVDTAYDVDPATSHDGVHTTPDLQTTFNAMLANYHQDRSATEIMRLAAEERNSIATLMAEYDSIVSLTDTTDWAAVLSRATGDLFLSAELAASDGYELLTSSLRRIAQRGHDVEGVVAAVAGERSLDGAQDSATVLDYRLRRWLDAAAQPEPEQLITGLFPVSSSDEPDVNVALDERQRAVEERAEFILEQGYVRHEPWVGPLGFPPEGEASLLWRDLAVTVAAYRDRWHVTDPVDPLGRVAEHNSEQRVQRDRARAALAALEQMNAAAADQRPRRGRDLGLDGLGGYARDDAPERDTPQDGGLELGL